MPDSVCYLTQVYKLCMIAYSKQTSQVKLTGVKNDLWCHDPQDSSKTLTVCAHCTYNVLSRSTYYKPLRCQTCVYHKSCMSALVEKGMDECLVCHTPLSTHELNVDTSTFEPKVCQVEQWVSAVATAVRVSKGLPRICHPLDFETAFNSYYSISGSSSGVESGVCSDSTNNGLSWGITSRGRDSSGSGHMSSSYLSGGGSFMAAGEGGSLSVAGGGFSDSCTGNSSSQLAAAGGSSSGGVGGLGSSLGSGGDGGGGLYSSLHPAFADDGSVGGDPRSSHTSHNSSLTTACASMTEQEIRQFQVC